MIKLILQCLLIQNILSFGVILRTLVKGGLQLWNLNQYSEINVKKYDLVNPSAPLASDSPSRVLYSSGRKALLFDPLEDKNLVEFMGHTGDITTLDMQNGRVLTGSKYDNTVRIFDAAKGLCLIKLKHEYPVDTANFAPDGKQFQVSLTNHKVRLYKLSNGQLIHEYDKHAGLITASGFSADSNLVQTVSDDCSVRLQSIPKHEAFLTIKHPAAVTDVKIDKYFLWTACLDGNVRKYSQEDINNELGNDIPFQEFNLIQNGKTDDKKIPSDLFPDQTTNTIVVIYTDGSSVIFDNKQGDAIHEINGTDKQLNSVYVSKSSMVNIEYDQDIQYNKFKKIQNKKSEVSINFDKIKNDKISSYDEWIKTTQKVRNSGQKNNVRSEPKPDTALPPKCTQFSLFHEDAEQQAVDQSSIVSKDLQSVSKQTTTEGLFAPCMVGALESQFLKMLCSTKGARTVLDIGTFTGMSAIAFAEAVPLDGKVVTLERDPQIAKFARNLFDQSSVGAKLDLRVGSASELMKQLQEQGATFDIIFLDADNEGQIDYQELALDGLFAKDGIILADNSLCALLQDDSDFRSQKLHEFNQHVKNDARTEQVVLTIREGITMIKRV